MDTKNNKANEPKYAYEFIIKGDKEYKIRVNEIDFTLFKLIRPYLKNDDTEKVLGYLKNAVISEDQELYSNLIQSNNLRIILALENAFARILDVFEVDVKKK